VLVVTVTLLAPAVAVALIDTTAVAVVVEVTVSELTVMPVPKVAAEVACTQCVNWPVRDTDRLVAPCWPLLGLASVSTGVPAVTVNPLVKLATSVPVVRVTALEPVTAVGAMFTTAVALVAEFTVSDATVIPAPKLATVVP
jgi:hypothetical protein